MTRLYFAYGANLNRASMSLRCPRARPRQALCLRDWCLEFAQHANIRAEPGSEVQGALWEITPECEASLDRFEGYPVYYDKHTVTWENQEVMFYVMQDPRPAMPSAGYLTTIAEGYADWGLDHESLWAAVRNTEEETDDLYWNSTTYPGSTLELDHSQSGLVAGHDHRDLRDMEHSH